MLCRSRSGGVIWESLPCEGGETEAGGFVGHAVKPKETRGERIGPRKVASADGLRRPSLQRLRQEQKKGGENVIFASRGGVGVANKAPGETAAPALPGRPAISLAKQQLLLRKETHHQRARLGDLLTPGVARVNEKKGVVSTKKTIEYY